jgi:pentatricopeptide repeat protein
MPPRPNLLAKCLSTFELPILPFLAPRVFQPWPARGLRTISKPRAARRDAVRHDRTRDIGIGGVNGGESTSRVWDSVNHSPTPAQVESRQHVLQAEKDSGAQAEGRVNKFCEAAGPADKDPTRHTWDQATILPHKEFGKPSKSIHNKLGVARRRQSRGVLLYGPKKDGKKGSSRELPRGLAKRLRSKRPIPELPSRGHSPQLPRASAGRVQRMQRPFKRSKILRVRKSMASNDWYHPKASIRPSFKGPLVCDFPSFQRRLDITAMHWNRAFYRQQPIRLVAFMTRPVSKYTVLRYINCKSSNTLREAWNKLSEKQRARLWPELVITTLRDNPAAAMKVLVGTYTTPYPQCLALSQTLDYLIHFYLGYEGPSKGNAALELLDAFGWLVQNGPADHIQISQRSIFLLLDHLPNAENIQKLFQTLDNYNHPLHRNTLMHFADRLAKAGGRHRDYAFDIMEIIGGLENVDFNRDEMMSLCTTLLMASGRDLRVHTRPPFVFGKETPVHVAKYNHTEVFEYMLKCGMKPNIITYNVLIFKTMAAREPGGWEIYNLMKENGIEPDAYTYSILLHDAKSRNDFEAIRHITTAVRERSLWCEHILADSLHAMLLSHERGHRMEIGRAKREQRQPKHGNTTVFERILPVYCEYFELEPLAHLVPGLEDLYRHITKSEYSPPREKHLFSPTPDVFVIMLSSLLRSFSDPDTPKIFYDHFSKLVRENDPLVARIAARSELHFRHLYNLVLFAFGQHASAIPDCLKVISDMSVKDPELADGEVAPLRPAKPDVSTWSIMVTIFGKHRQTRAAEKVIEMMRQRGIEPDNFTWHSLLAGYTGIQETRMSIDVLARLQDAGYEIDEHMWSALRQLRDRRTLIEGIQRLEAEREQREMARIEEVRDEVMRGAEAEAAFASETDTNAMQDSQDFVIGDMPAQDPYEVLQKKGPGW